MIKTVFAAMTLSAVLALPARANVQQANAQQRREIENKMRELERQMEDLQRQLGDGPRVRTRVFGGSGPEIMRVGPGGRVFTMTSRPKFGFQFEAVADSGVKVVSVSPGSPAEKAGLKWGDFITMFNGVRLTGVEDPDDQLRKQAEDLEVGDTVSVEFRRGAEKKSGKMVAADLGPNAFAYAFTDDSAMHMEMPGMTEQLPKMFGMLPGRWMDMEMVSLNKDLGEYFGTPEGVLVVRAPKDSSLALKSGDVILSIDGRKPTTPPQALRILRSYDRGESFEVVVLRQKKKVTLTGKVSDRDRGYFYEYKTPEREQYKVPQNDQQ